MLMKASTFSVVATFPTADGAGRRRRLIDWETRAEAEAYAAQLREMQMVEGATFVVMLLDRHPEQSVPVETAVKLWGPTTEAEAFAGADPQQVSIPERAFTIEGQQEAWEELDEEMTPARIDQAMAEREEDLVRRMLTAALRRPPLASEVRRAVQVWEG